MARTNPAEQRELYNRITVRDAARRLGVSQDHVLALGVSGELDVVDLRRPGAARGVYRVAPASLEALIDRRSTTRKSA